MLLIILKGIFIGFIVSAPIGPIGFLCMQYAQKGFNSAIMAGLGAALADTIFAAIAGFGLTLITTCLETYESLFHIVGGLFLSIVGSVLLFSSPSLEHPNETRGSLLKVAASTFFLTLSNPFTILAFIALIGNFGLNSCPIEVVQTSLLLVGVFIGGMFCWTLLAFAASLFMHKLGANLLLQFRRLGGILLFISGIVAMLKGCRF